MPLKGIVATLDGLDEATQKLYTKRDDGKFMLDVEGLVDKGKLEEFRTNNVEMEKRIAKLTEQIKTFEGIDPAKAKEALDALQKIQEKKLIDEGNVEALFEQRTTKMKGEHTEQLSAKDKKIAELTAEIAKITEESKKTVLLNHLQKALESPELGFHPNVADLIKQDVFREFQYRDDKVVRVKPDGTLVYGKNGDPVGLTEFLQDIAKERPYLVKPSSGSGAHNNGKEGSNGKRQIDRKTFETWPQLQRTDWLKAKNEVVDVLR